jgi:hypothetical protein
MCIRSPIVILRYYSTVLSGPDPDKVVFASQVWRCVNVQLSDMSESAMGRGLNLRSGSNWLVDPDFGRRLMVTRCLYTIRRWTCLCRLV